MAQNVVVAAFTEDYVERLAGLSKKQLRYWDKTGFFSPSLGDDERGNPYARIYSFRDVVGLRTLGILRNQHDVPLQHLRQVAKALSHLKESLWTTRTLYVLNRRVVIQEEGSGKLQDPVTGQYVIGIPLKMVMSDVAREAAELRARNPDSIGKIGRNRFVAQNEWTVSGTRIPVRVIKSFHEAGYSVDAIMREYPSLTEQDIKAAIAHKDKVAAAA